ncbi:MAG: DUF493 domain-containing protein [Isosphaeraceae bacterium]
MDPRPPADLLESVHTFPGTFQIRAIGSADGDFVGRVRAAVEQEVAEPGEYEYSTRETAGGKHVSVALRIQVQSAEQVRNIYAKLAEVEGIRVLL